MNIDEPADLLVHGTSVAVGGRAILLRGPSGSGKSDLALRLIDRGACLVADDQSLLRRRGDRIVVSPPATIVGLLEIRGVGIVRVAHVAEAVLAMIVDLVPAEAVERLPPEREESVLGLAIPLMSLAPHEASGPAKLRFALANLAGSAPPAILGR